MGGTAKSLPPPSKKYANVKARLDTGCNELKIKGSETKANARFHRGENFRRLKVHTLHLAAAFIFAADCSKLLPHILACAAWCTLQRNSAHARHLKIASDFIWSA